jgi:uncharacterized membrane protein
VYVTGAVVTAAAIGLAMGNRRVALLHGCACLLAAVALHLPLVLRDVTVIGRWTYMGKGLTLGGCALMISGRAWGKYFLVGFMLLSGVLHFVVRDFVASLVPPWMPWRYFWSDFAGVALIAGGIGMVVPRMARPAAILSGGMILSWVPLVHVRYVFQNAVAITHVFEALAFGSAALLAASMAARSQVRVAAASSTASRMK